MACNQLVDSKEPYVTLEQVLSFHDFLFGQSRNGGCLKASDIPKCQRRWYAQIICNALLSVLCAKNNFDFSIPVKFFLEISHTVVIIVHHISFRNLSLSQKFNNFVEINMYATVFTEISYKNSTAYRLKSSRDRKVKYRLRPPPSPLTNCPLPPTYKSLAGCRVFPSHPTILFHPYRGHDNI